MELFNWYERHQIKAIVDAHFVDALHSYQKECSAECATVFRGASISEVTTELDTIRHSTAFDFHPGTVEVVLNILLDHQRIGWYKEIFNIDGVSIDEFFVIGE